MTCSEVEIPNVAIVPLSIDENTKDIKSSSFKDLTKPQLIEAISWIMEDIIESKGNSFTNENEIPNKTAFHARTLPTIKLTDYITRFSQYANCQDDVFLSTLIYMDRIGEAVTQFSLDSFNVHKLLLISMSVACKFHYDNYFTNTYYANVGGISVEEFNSLEEEYLINYLQFQLYVKSDTYDTYRADIINYYHHKIQNKRN